MGRGCAGGVAAGRGGVVAVVVVARVEGGQADERAGGLACGLGGCVEEQVVEAGQGIGGGDGGGGGDAGELGLLEPAESLGGHGVLGPEREAVEVDLVDLGDGGQQDAWLEEVGQELVEGWRGGVEQVGGNGPGRWRGVHGGRYAVGR